MNPTEKKIWFPAKRYGWGWGPPNCWQGWTVMAIWIALLTAGAFLAPPDRHPVVFAIWVALLVVCLIVICWLKGEKPKWRWGDK